VLAVVLADRGLVFFATGFFFAAAPSEESTVGVRFADDFLATDFLTPDFFPLRF
jgi:hypothetical protein